MEPYTTDLLNTSHHSSLSGGASSRVIHEYAMHTKRISRIHQAIYIQNGISKSRLLLYISLLLTDRNAMVPNAKKRVGMKVAEPPRPNQAVSENGIYISRNTRAKSTENVTVPISWYLPKRYPDSNWLRDIDFDLTVANLWIFKAITKTPILNKNAIFVGYG